MKYSVGHIILAHTNLNRVLELVHYLTENSSPVVVHVDKKTSNEEYSKLCTDLAENDLVYFVPRINAEWGQMSLVTATLNCARAMIEEFPNVGHIFLTSGSCLPAKPIAELQEFLSRHQGTDFVESVSIESEDWVQDGLNAERFKFFFPFSWQKQRRMFDMATWVQRKLNINRKRPDNFTPHLGSQWWCMTKRTLIQILNDPSRRAYDRFFAKSWIPDESYFQTLARKHSERLESRSLTWSKFDGQGKPFLLYDDHAELFPNSDFFMARKVWPKADLLYKKMLNQGYAWPLQKGSSKTDLSLPFEVARKTQAPTLAGKSNPGRFPTGAHAKKDKTARPYTVLIGARCIFPDLQDWINLNANVRCHGNLFDQDEVQFDDGPQVFAGNVSANRLIRNYRAQAFLANVIWNDRNRLQTFFFDLGDNQKAHDAIFKDRNANVIMIEEAWILHFLGLQKTGADTRSKAKLLHAGEQRLERVIARASTAAKISRYSIKEVMLNPNGYLKQIQETSTQMATPLVSTPKQDVDLVQLNKTIYHLRNEGFKIKTDEISLQTMPNKTHLERPRLID